jgi:phosphatidylglycerol---prolipoprotein diacylglyceryl transferase
MYPVLFHIGPIPINSYGLLIAIGFLTALQLIQVLAIRTKGDPQKYMDLAFYTLLVGFLGARILYVFTRWEDQFSNDLLSIFKLWEGGLVFYGVPVWNMLDIFTIGLVAAHGFGRLGCLMAGCCYGRPTGTGFGIKLYSDLVDPAFRGVNLHPTQIYESASLFTLAAGLWFLFARRKFEGQVVLTYLMVYPVIRSVIEMFRGDSIRGFVIEGVLSTSQFISVFVFLGAMIAIAMRLRAVRSSGASR